MNAQSVLKSNEIFCKVKRLHPLHLYILKYNILYLCFMRSNRTRPITWKYNNFRYTRQYFPNWLVSIFVQKNMLLLQN